MKWHFPSGFKDTEFDEKIYPGLGYYNKPLDVVVDIGAHVGTFAIRAVEKGAELVFAFEASAQNHLCLVANIIEHNLSGKIIPFHLAVLPTGGIMAQLFSLRGDANSGQRGTQFRKDCEWEPVFSISFRDLLTSMFHLFGKIDYLKVDVEGGEWDLFVPGTEDLLQKVSFLDIEMHERQPFYFAEEHCKNDLTSIVRFLTSNNFVELLGRHWIEGFFQRRDTLVC